MPRLRVLAPIAILLAVLIARRRRRAPAPPLRTRVVAPALSAPPRFLSVPWTLADAPADRPELTVRFARDAHMELDRVDVQETPTQVFVTVLVRWHPPAGHGGPPASDAAEETTVPLAAPLGERELIHAPTDLDRPADRPL
jgi:hypothetical protein